MVLRSILHAGLLFSVFEIFQAWRRPQEYSQGTPSFGKTQCRYQHANLTMPTQRWGIGVHGFVAIVLSCAVPWLLHVHTGFTNAALLVHIMNSSGSIIKQGTSNPHAGSALFTVPASIVSLLCLHQQTLITIEIR